MKKKILILILLFLCKKSIATDLIIYKGELWELDLSRNSLLSIFTKKQKYWNDGHKITVFIKPINSVEHKIFLSDLIGISSYRYKKKLKNEIYSGQTQSVREVRSDEEMIRSILETPYSIGYLSDGALLYAYVNTDNSDVRIIYYE